LAAGDRGEGNHPQPADPSAPAGTAAPAPRPGSDLKVRFLSALLLGPPVLLAVWVGGVVFQAVVVLIAGLAVREWVRLVEPSRPVLPLGLSLAAVGAVVLGAVFWGGAAALYVAGGAFLLLGAVAKLMGLRHGWLLAASVPYIAIACVALIWLRIENGEAGLSLFLYLLLVNWGTDVGAYAAGRTIGGPKLAPRFSPKKTWAGLIGGMVAAALLGGAVAWVHGSPALAGPMIVGALLAVVGQAGDLFESYMKRRSHVKDSGTLIPGHGGLLDRIDGLIAAAPVLALVHALWGDALKWW